MPAAVQYYYVPEIDGYYDVLAQRYIVPRNGQWVPVSVIPGYNPAHFHPVVVDYRGQPWTQYRDHHARYYRPVVMKQRPVAVDRGNRGHSDHADCGRGPR